MRFIHFMVSILFLFSAQVHGDRPQYIERTFPFNLSLNMSDVYAVTTARPENLVKTIQSFGVQILVVKSQDPKGTPNPILRNLPEAPKSLIDQAEFDARLKGKMVLHTNPCCKVKQDTMLILETAHNHTVLHEYLHAAIRLKGTPAPDIEATARAAIKKLAFYMRKLQMKPENLMNAQWRRDILPAYEDVINSMFDHFQIGLSQEAVIEKILAKYITANSPYYNPLEQTFGYRFGEDSINEAIESYNFTDAQLSWCKNTVNGLSEALSSEEMTPAAAKQFAQEVNRLLNKMEPVKAEILALKDFYIM